ncbi:putative F-box/LRR-repeat protein 23 [Salvia splendens]|uniref:putative F-box/LRR-repeat protein 23 n=1 Tax=Salvia splendens TaxID=180675 RepID=UPI001102C754|nr:putative F-box/LRR-repeat protein 23 [Salvia splendens]
MSKAPDYSAAPPWIELPEELTANILQRLHAEQRLGIEQLVCSTWRRVCKNPAMWRVIDLDYRRCDSHDVLEFELICRGAVNRSQGQLIELKVINLDEEFGFLNYAAERSSQLRCLTLAGYEQMETALTDIMKKLPQLEELHLIRMPPLTPKQFASIGISCPMLKSFTYNEHCYEHPLFPEDEAFDNFCTKHAIAIGQSMPNLRHLRLWDLYMRNKGVEAIIDGCPHLESLDLRRCSGVDLDEALFNRCIEQIKDLILPTDGNTSDPDLLEDPGYESWDVIKSSNLVDFCMPDSSDDDGCGGFAGSYDFKPF